MATTLKDIADATGVSMVSVSKALRGTGRIAPETRDRILRAAKDLRYRPNALARSMRKGRTGNIGFIYTAEETPTSIRLDVFGGIQDVLRDHSYNLVIGEVPNRALTQPAEVSSLLRDWTADGLIIYHHLHLPQLVAELVEGDHIPAIWVNSRQRYNCVYFGDFGAAKDAVLHLASLGHKRIAYFDHTHGTNSLASPVHYSVTDRLAGYRAGMEKLGLKPIVLMEEEEVPHAFRTTKAREILSARNRPTAFLSYGTLYSLFFAAASLGLRIPRDLSIVGFADSNYPINDLRPAILFLDQNALARAATELLFSRILSTQSPVPPSRPRALPVELRPGDCIAPPPRK